MIDNGLGTFEYTTLDSILAGAKARLRLRDTTSDDLLLKDFIIEGIKKSRLPQLFIRKETYLDIENSVAEVPCDFVRFDRTNPIRLDDEFGNETYLQPTYIGQTFFQPSDSDTNAYSYYTVTLNGKFLFFSSDVTAPRCKVSYLGTNLDESGELLIPEIMESILIAYACWCYCKTYFDKYPADIRSAWEMEWKLNKKAVKGIMNQPDGLQNKLLRWRMNTTL